MKQIKLLVVGLLFMAMSCKSTEQVFAEKWNGKSKSELVLEKGKARSVEDDLNGGEIHTYFSRITKRVDIASGKGVWRDKLFMRKEIYFFNSEGVIYNVKVIDEPLES